MAAAGDAYEFDAQLCLYPGEAGWHFVTLPPNLSDEARSGDGVQDGDRVELRVALAAPGA
ncbi:MAG: hypothetical protein ACM3NV_10920 [Syntrophothermus sp.]